MKTKSISIFSFLLLVLLSACATEPTPATPNPGEIVLTMAADKVGAEATQAAINSKFTATAQIAGATATQQALYVQATATQQARVDTQATADQARKDAQATSEQERRDIQATQARIDADATQAQARRDVEATANQARLDLVATQQAVGTATAFSMTQVVAPTYNFWTQQANEQEIEIGGNEVKMSDLEVSQQQQKNTVEWALPAILALMGGLVGTLFVVRYSRTREVKDDDGRIRLIIHDNKNAIKPNLLPGPVLDLQAQNMPQLVEPKEQSKVTERAQKIHAIEALPPAPAVAGMQAFNSFFGEPEKPRFEMLEEGEAPPADMLDPDTVRVIERDWQDPDE